jgi:hypothetical protein
MIASALERGDIKRRRIDRSDQRTGIALAMIAVNEQRKRINPARRFTKHLNASWHMPTVIYVGQRRNRV